MHRVSDLVLPKEDAGATAAQQTRLHILMARMQRHLPADAVRLPHLQVLIAHNFVNWSFHFALVVPFNLSSLLTHPAREAATSRFACLAPTFVFQVILIDQVGAERAGRDAAQTAHAHGSIPVRERVRGTFVRV